jgi:branched-chain amino acid transport system permease protein
VTAMQKKSFAFKNYMLPVGLALLVLINLLLLLEFFGIEIIDRYYKGILVLMQINIILAIGLNLINGVTGMLSLGHAGFMAVGAYTSALLSIFLTKVAFLPPVLQFPLVLIVGGLVAALIGLLIGIPTLRLRGDYLAIATLGFGEIIRVVILNLKITKGALGLPGIPGYTDFWWAELFMLLSVIIIWNFTHSNHGRALASIRENEIAAEAMGINTTYYKVSAFVIGAFFAGLAGGLFAHYLGYIAPKSFDFMKSIEILLMVVLGGLGSLTGSVVAAIVLTGLPEVLRFLQSYRMVIYSLTLVLLMLYRPQGLFGRDEASAVFLKQWFKKGLARKGDKGGGADEPVKG